MESLLVYDFSSSRVDYHSGLLHQGEPIFTDEEMRLLRKQSAKGNNAEVSREALKTLRFHVVCVITGSGLKDPSFPSEYSPSLIQVPAEVKAVTESLDWY